MEKGRKKNLWNFLQESINAKSIVFVAMLVVGGFCFILSAMNTTNYLQMTGIHSGKALLTGLALVIFSSTCLTSAQLFLQKSGVVKLFSIPFIVIGIVVIVFSMFSTLSLNYAKFRQSESVQKEIEAKTAIEKSKIQSEKSDVKDWSMEKVNEVLNLSKETGESWATTLGQVATISKSLSEIESQENEQISVEILPASFFEFMLSIATIEKKYAFDFFMLAIPAIFYDLIAPLALTVVLFLLKKEKQKSEKSDEKSEKETEIATEEVKIAEKIEENLQENRVVNRFLENETDESEGQNQTMSLSEKRRKAARKRWGKENV